ncbi:MAG: DUF1850 domain-containing protein [Mesorhizobium sp.]|nr:DUF1850 domain-containing protein [Mesorhizobium sp.]
MPICLIAGGKATAIALASFTLAWTHSVEKVRWEEDWELSGAGLRIVEARVKGSGAGMEVPDGAVLRDGVWRYVPSLPPQRELLLARSGATAGGWELCAEDRCREIGTGAGAAVKIAACTSEPAND